MEKEVIENKLRRIPHKFFFVNGKSFKTIHNNKENAITMLMDMTKMFLEKILQNKNLIKEYSNLEDNIEINAENYTRCVITAYKIVKSENYKLSMRDMKPILSVVKEKYPSVDGNEIRKILQEIIGE